MENLTLNDNKKMVELYFKKKNKLYEMQYKSFSYLIEKIIFNRLNNGPNTFKEVYTTEKKYVNYFKFSNVSLKPPMMQHEDTYMWPEDARRLKSNYSSKLIAHVTQFLDIIDINTNEVETKQISDTEMEVPIALIPIMVRSAYCTTNLKSDVKNTECPYDPGCYFIINGNEKIVLSVERIQENKILVFPKKDTTSPTGYSFHAQINSKPLGRNDIIQLTALKIKKDKSLILLVNQFHEVPLFIMMRALGIEKDEDIIKLIVLDDDDFEMKNILRNSLLNLQMDQTKPESESNPFIRTQEQAFEFLQLNIKYVFRYFTESDEELRKKQMRMHIMKILHKDFLPHQGENLYNKALFLGHMVHRLFRVQLGRDVPDDRDSYLNKRIDLPGTLIGQLFHHFYRKMLTDIGNFFQKKNNDDENPTNVISQIKPTTIEQGIKSALTTGVWGPNKNKKGIAQALQRESYMQTISYFRRIITPSPDSSTSKLTSIRHIQNTQLFFICAVETPEGAKIGLLKTLSNSANISMNMEDQRPIIEKILNKYVKTLEQVPISDFTKYTKVFVNGTWYGLTSTPYEVINDIKTKKFNLILDKSISCYFHTLRNEIRVYCDGGRIYRPLLRVDSDKNQLYLTKKMLDSINLKNMIETKDNIVSWNKFLEKYKGVVDFIDIEESETLMISMYPEYLKQNRDKMNNYSKNSDIILNRYQNTYIKYTHCELHPQLLLGITSSNIPFAEHNQAPRNIYNFSQRRQAAGIYASNYRYRHDISYILYNVQRPIVITDGMRWTHNLDLPAGENCVVAIAPYTGYNQEDSIIVNKSAVGLGLFRSAKYKKYSSEIQKNPTTSQDDIFTKPDKTKVTGIKDANYDKLNNKGFVEEETTIENGDILIGKISPVQPTGSDNKLFKDDSLYFKSGVSGVVDQVNTGIFNSEGYEMYTMKVRTERIPTIGDKLSSQHGQKGTIGLLLSAADMPFTKDGIQPDLIINPCCIPSRMTIGQLLECVMGKANALNGSYSDATPFNDYGIEDAKKILKSYGFNEYGYETLYNGMTGQKMQAQIFIGPTYYLRLKHMVLDKIHSRAGGPRQILTRQPPEGRSRDGGLRFGEMERDTMIAHGMSQFLNERFLETSDKYDIYVCNNCGLFATKKIKNDIYYCKRCDRLGEDYNVHKVRTCYAFKLFIQELMSINILPRLKIEESVHLDTIS
jgi:DNA-directed RNA polymerase II subunit RPB2